MFEVGDRVTAFFNADVGEVSVTLTSIGGEYVQGTVDPVPEGWEGSPAVGWKTSQFQEKVAAGDIYATP